MNTETTSLIPKQAFDWYDEYCHGDIDRRTFLARLGTLAGAGVSMSLLTGALLPNYAEAEQVSFNDPEIKATYATFESPKGNLEGRGYLVVPQNLSAKTGTVLVVHENRGLNPYIADVARRAAKAGFIAFAPDALYPLGGYPGNDDEGRAMQKSMDRGSIEQDFIAAANFLKGHEMGNGKLGVVGFCFGGYISNYLAAAIPDVVDAAAPFYGTPAGDDIVNNVKGPMLMHYAENDPRVNATKEGYEATLKKNGVKFESFTYADCNHGFHNDSTGRYVADAAELAWNRTLNFFEENLG